MTETKSPSAAHKRGISKKNSEEGHLGDYGDENGDRKKLINTK